MLPAFPNWQRLDFMIVHQLEAELDLSKPIIDSPHTIMPTELGLQSGPSA